MARNTACDLVHKTRLVCAEPMDEEDMVATLGRLLGTSQDRFCTSTSPRRLNSSKQYSRQRIA